jgi:hypothetical protein
MKKLITLLIVLFISWLLATYYFGHKTEQVFKDYIEQSNKQSKDLYDVSIKLTSYKKSFLFSVAEIEIDVIEPGLRNDIAEFIKLPIKSNFNIKHGPIFFEDKLSIGLAQVNNVMHLSDILSSENKHDILKYIDGEIKISNDMNFSFNDEINATSIIDGINFSTESGAQENNVSITPITLSTRFNLEKGLNAYKGGVKFGDLTINAPQLYFNMHNVMVETNVEELFGGFYPLGDSKITVENVTVRTTETNIPPIEFSIAINSKSIKENDKLNDRGTMKIDIKNPDRISSKLPVSNISISGSLEGIAEKDVSALSNLISMSSAMDENYMLNEYANWFNDFLSSGDINYNFKILTRKNIEKGLSKVTGKVDIDLNYVGSQYTASNFDETLVKFQLNPFNLFTTEVDILIDKDWFNLLDSVASKEINVILPALVANGTIKETESDYSIAASYKNQKIMVNGKYIDSDLLNYLPQLPQLKTKSMTKSQCSGVIGVWYYYETYDEKDSIYFGKMQIQNNGNLTVKEVGLNLNNSKLSKEKMNEIWQCDNENYITFEGINPDDNESYQYKGVITTLDKNNFVFENKDEGEWEQMSVSPHINLSLIKEVELRKRTKKVLNKSNINSIDAFFNTP